MSYNIKSLLGSLGESDITLLSRYFGLSEFHNKNEQIHNLLKGGMPKKEGQTAKDWLSDATLKVKTTYKEYTKALAEVNAARVMVQEEESAHEADTLEAGTDETKEAAPDSVTKVPAILRQKSDIFSEQQYYDKSFPSYIRLFNTNVFIDENSKDDDGTVCLSISFPNTASGERNRAIKIKDFDTLLSKRDYETVLANFVFIPTHITRSKRLFSCRLNILSLRDGRKERQEEGRHYLNTVSSRVENALSPTKKSLYMLLHCVIIASNFLFKNNYDILSLNLDDILHLHTRSGFLITNYSIKKEGGLEFSIQRKKFIEKVLELWDNYNISLEASMAQSRERINYHKEIIRTLELSTTSETVRASINNKKGIITILEKGIQSEAVKLKKYKDSSVIQAINDYIIPYVNTLSATPEKVYETYMKYVRPEIEKDD